MCLYFAYSLALDANRVIKPFVVKRFIKVSIDKPNGMVFKRGEILFRHERWMFDGQNLDIVKEVSILDPVIVL